MSERKQICKPLWWNSRRVVVYSVLELYCWKWRRWR